MRKMRTWLMVFVVLVFCFISLLAGNIAEAANEGIYYVGDTTTTTINAYPGYLKTIIITNTSTTDGTVTIDDGTASKAVLNIDNTAPIILENIMWRFFTSCIIQNSTDTIHGTYRYEP